MHNAEPRVRACVHHTLRHHVHSHTSLFARTNRHSTNGTLEERRDAQNGRASARLRTYAKHPHRVWRTRKPAARRVCPRERARECVRARRAKILPPAKRSDMFINHFTLFGSHIARARAHWRTGFAWHGSRTVLVWRCRRMRRQVAAAAYNGTIF